MGKRSKTAPEDEAQVDLSLKKDKKHKKDKKKDEGNPEDSPRHVSWESHSDEGTAAVSDDKKDKKKKKDKKDRKDDAKKSKKRSSAEFGSDNETDAPSKFSRMEDSESEASEPCAPTTTSKPQVTDPNGFYVFVNDLTFHTSEEDLCSFFSDCPGLERIRWQQSNHGKAFVQFSTEAGQRAAVAKSGQNGPGGRPVRVFEHNFAKWFIPEAVSVDAEEQYKDAVTEALGKFGRIQDCQCHGKCMLVVFSSEQEADNCVAASPINIDGYDTRVNLAASRFCYGLSYDKEGSQGSAFGNNRQFNRGGQRGGQRGGRGGGRGGFRGRNNAY